MKKQITTIRLSPSDRDALARVAEDDEVSSAAIVRRAIKRYLKEVEQQRQAVPAHTAPQAPLAI